MSSGGEPAAPSVPTSIRRSFRNLAALPSHVALIEGKQHITYGTLDRESNRLARLLRSRDVRPRHRIAVDVDVSSDAVMSLLGVLKAGCVCVPLDVGLPIHRRRQILSASKAIARVSTRADLEATPSCRFIPLVDRESMSDEELDEVEGVQPTDPCLILFTSGSTGEPKGVIVSQDAFEHHFSSIESAYPLSAADVALAYRPCSVVASIWDHLGPLLQGVPTVLVSNAGGTDPTEIVRAAVAHGVSYLSGCPSLWQAILDQPRKRLSQWRTLRLGLSSGERLSAAVVQRFSRCFESATLLNVYGGTECGRPCFYNASQFRGGAEYVPVGRPTSNVSIALLDPVSEPVPIGEVGEVVVTGSCVALGYLNERELTAERFSSQLDPNLRTFRTGDLGRWSTSGDLEIVGRADSLVKIRGNRVELGEIESVLRRHCAVREAAVVTGAGADECALVAYVTSSEKPAPKSEELLDHLRSALPSYMVPPFITVLDALPKTPSGKVDVQALLRLGSAASLPALDAPALTATEQWIADIVAESLNLPFVGAGDSFFRLGGHSLLAMQIVARVFDEFGVDLPLHVFLAPDVTIHVLATAIDDLTPAG